MKKSIFIIAAIMAITLLMARPAQSQSNLWYLRGGVSTVSGVIGLEHFVDASYDYSLGVSIGFGGRVKNGDAIVGVGAGYFFEGDPLQSGFYLFGSLYSNYVKVTEDASDTYYDVFTVGSGYRFVLGDNFDLRLGGGAAFGAPKVVPAVDMTLGWDISY